MSTCSWTDELKDKWSPCNNSWASRQEISEKVALTIMSKKLTHKKKHTIGKQILIQAKVKLSFQKNKTKTLHIKLPSHDTLTQSLSEAQCQRLCHRILGLVQSYSETINLVPPFMTLILWYLWHVYTQLVLACAFTNELWDNLALNNQKVVNS